MYCACITVGRRKEMQIPRSKSFLIVLRKLWVTVNDYLYLLSQS
nr:MAG TPA: hypothetical protein [Caudoviricetes sp.]